MDSQKKMMVGQLDESNTLGDEDLDLPFFSFGDIVSATNNFAEDNMLGQGGFGKVYKVIKVNILNHGRQHGNYKISCLI